MKRTRLLAKSYDRALYPSAPPDYALLTQHSRDVAAACGALADVLGPIALQVAELDPRYQSQFSTTLRLNGWSQDLGKANSHFQAMVSNDPEILQLVRHETVSGMLLWLDPAFRRWLAPLRHVLTSAVWGAVGHHRKFDDRATMNQGAALVMHVAHEDFNAILRDMAADLGLAEPPHFDRDFTLGRDARDRADRAAMPMFHAMVQDFCDAESEYEDERARRSLALVKGLGIAADVAASAVAKSGVVASNYSLDTFVRRKLATRLTHTELTGLIHRWAWKRNRGGATPDLSRLPSGFVIRPFQEQVERSPSYLTLAEAGCGSGKSLAAYLWARAWCARREATDCPAFRLFFCLPTTGTTTEHFKDYALEADVPVDLVHSRSSVDLQTLAQTSNQEEAQDPADGRNDQISTRKQAAREALLAERDKIEALALWETRIAVTTADTVLGLMANARRGLCALPAILQSAIVFDEIHAFDDQLFGHLLVFLRTFPRLPVLLMTASLPEARRRSLVEARPDLQVVAGPPDLERLPRYRLEEASAEDVWTAVSDHLDRRGKVLWVRNRVDWANQTYAAARKRFGDAHVDVYHSRLRYVDRSHRHRRVIDRFQKPEEPALLVATQVAEMSLDLSADLLISDEAPIPSLIQRLGRLNRRATPEAPGTPKQAMIAALSAGDELPYGAEALAVSRRWRSLLIARGRPLNQSDLAEQFAAIGSEHDRTLDYAVAEEQSCFLGVPERSGLWRTKPGKTRAEGYTVTVLLKNDLEALERFPTFSRSPSTTWLREHEVSIPMKDAVLGWNRVAGLPVAPEEAILYDYDDSTHEGTGARWRES